MIRDKKITGGVVNKSLTYWEMYGVSLFGRDKALLLKLLSSHELKTPVWIATVNPEFIMNSLKDREFMDILQSRTTVNVVDGIGLAWAREVIKQKNIVKKLVVGFWEGVKVLSGNYQNKIISGVELTDDLCRMAAKNGKTVFFLGGWNDRGERTAAYFQKKYPKLKVAGCYAGKREGEDEKIIKLLSKKKIDYLFVAFAMKTQEEFINRNLEKFKVEVVMGLGRTFDYYSGELPRAPKWMRKIGLEWFYSLLTDKGRRKRKLELLKFIWRVLTT